MNDTAKQEAGGLAAALGGRSIVLVGMMGAGKTSVGKRLAQRLGLPFVDADAEIEAGARMTIPEIFERFGEPYFRDGERKVIARLLEEGPKVLATGGGAFMNAATRERIAERGRFDLAQARFRGPVPPRAQALEPAAAADRRSRGDAAALLDERSPTYALADITIESRDGPHDAVVEAILDALRRPRAASDAGGDARGRGRARRARLRHPDRRRADRTAGAHDRGDRSRRALRHRHRRDGGEAASRRRCERASRRPG